MNSSSVCVFFNFYHLTTKLIVLSSGWIYYHLTGTWHRVDYCVSSFVELFRKSSLFGHIMGDHSFYFKLFKTKKQMWSRTLSPWLVWILRMGKQRGLVNFDTLMHWFLCCAIRKYFYTVIATNIWAARALWIIYKYILFSPGLPKKKKSNFPYFCVPSTNATP